jgi:leucyl-tRNA synthetase
MSKKYEPKDIEAKWQNNWDTEGIYKVSDDASKKKHYILDMFPYPSGEGLHVGHPRGYIATDVYSRFKRMHGYNVLHPMGWDAFGLPAENFAIKNKVHPREAVDRNVARFKEQLSIIGPDYDWSHEINTTDPEFYKWTQWMFLKMYEQGLAYESYEPINWCPGCQTGLANEDLEADGTCERCGSVVEKKPMRQWVLRITDYADRLLADLDTLPKWPEGVKEAQRNWIGKSEGSEITFSVKNGAPKEKYLIIDFDGVVGDTFETGIQAKMAMDNISYEQALKNTIEYASRKPSHTRGASKEEVQHADDWNDRFSKEMDKLEPKLFDGFVDELLKLEDTKIAFVSSGSTPYIKRLLAQTKLQPTHVLAYEDHHSKEEKVEKVCNDWGIEIHEAYYITDTKADVYELESIMDKKKILGCPWGYLGYDALAEVLPKSQILDSFEDIHNKITTHFPVFTTRADTLFGATYVVLAPEHELVAQLAVENRAEVDAYIAEVAQKSEIDRTAEGKEKTGVKLEGVTVINPANNEELPVYIADYVLAHYGTGAVMAVPAHDERDFEFAKKFDLPIKTVVVPSIEDKDNPHIDGWEVKERNNVHAVVYDPKQDAYLTLVWHDYDWQTIVLGGIDEGEDIIECAKREIAEETGYTNVEFKKHLGAPIQTLYAAPHKKVNRLAWSTGLYFELIDDTQIEVSREEHEKFDITWMPAQDFIPENITNVELPFWQERIRGEEKAWTQLGVLIESGEFNGMTSVEAKQKITEFVGGEMKSTYRLNDWVFSRQRYWGEPIPIIHCAKCGAVPVPYEQLPVVLPDVDSYEPTGTGESPLADIEDWVNVDCPTCGEHAKRETNTMPQWAGSSWYYLRYVDPQNGEVAIDSDKEKHWLPVDVYVGGDHATRHLIYARFWHKFLHDINVVSDLEPFPRLEFLGFIQAEDGRKMSKRWGNIVNPDEMVDRFGADAFRLYEMFIGPFENTVPWSTDGLVGTRRFVEKVWRQQYKLHDDINDSLEILLHKTIKKVTTDIEGFKFNTAVSQMMILVNEMDKAEVIGKEQYAIFLRLLAPFMPHATEEIWRTTLGNAGSIHVADWPKYDESKTVESEIKMVVQVNGKVRATIMVASDISEADAVALARGDVNVQKHISGEPKKTIFVPGKLISFVV